MIPVPIIMAFGMDAEMRPSKEIKLMKPTIFALYSGIFCPIFLFLFYAIFSNATIFLVFTKTKTMSHGFQNFQRANKISARAIKKFHFFLSKQIKIVETMWRTFP